MIEEIGSSRGIEEHGETVGRLLRLAGHRPGVPEKDAAVIKEAAQAEWRRTTRAYRRRTVLVRLGAGLAAAAVFFLVLATRWQQVPGVATLETMAGALSVSPGNEKGALVADPAAGYTFAGGSMVETHSMPAAWAALRLAGGAALRLDAGTRLRLISPSAVELEHGAVYVDTGEDGKGGSVEIRTALGVARDIGTRFHVRVEPEEGSLKIRVDAGTVALEHGSDSALVDAGYELTAMGDTAPAVREASRFVMDGRSLYDLLEWAAEANIWELHFAGDAEEMVRSAGLEGDTPGSTPEESAFWMLRAAGLSGRLEGGKLHVEPSP